MWETSTQRGLHGASEDIYREGGTEEAGLRRREKVFGFKELIFGSPYTFPVLLRISLLGIWNTQREEKMSGGQFGL